MDGSCEENERRTDRQARERERGIRWSLLPILKTAIIAVHFSILVGTFINTNGCH